MSVSWHDRTAAVRTAGIVHHRESVPTLSCRRYRLSTHLVGRVNDGLQRFSARTSANSAISLASTAFPPSLLLDTLDDIGWLMAAQPCSHTWLLTAALAGECVPGRAVWECASACSASTGTEMSTTSLVHLLCVPALANGAAGSRVRILAERGGHRSTPIPPWPFRCSVLFPPAP